MIWRTVTRCRDWWYENVRLRLRMGTTGLCPCGGPWEPEGGTFDAVYARHGCWRRYLLLPLVWYWRVFEWRQRKWFHGMISGVVLLTEVEGWRAEDYRPGVKVSLGGGTEIRLWRERVDFDGFNYRIVTLGPEWEYDRETRALWRTG